MLISSLKTSNIFIKVILKSAYGASAILDLLGSAVAGLLGVSGDILS